MSVLQEGVASSHLRAHFGLYYALGVCLCVYEREGERERERGRGERGGEGERRKRAKKGGRVIDKEATLRTCVRYNY